MTDNTENEEPCIDEARARMSPGDAAEWEEIQGWKEEQMAKIRVLFLGASARSS